MSEESNSTTATESQTATQAAAPAVPTTAPQEQRPEIVRKFDQASLPDMLPIYYKRLFPHKPFYRWLIYGLSEPNIFTNREISFTLQDDIYIRFLCYESQSELEKEICAKCPYKIDIGAVMTTRPRNFRISSASMIPMQRELVFDIDMTDYDDVRTCCQGTDVCQKCWKFLVIAVQLLDSALQEDFGFENILWVFSGRRGIHCWVCDYDARHLDARGRSAISEYFQILKYIQMNGVNVARIQLSGDRIHHSIRRALNIIEPMFEEIILIEQNLFAQKQGLDKLLHLIPDAEIRNEAEIYLRQIHKDGGANSKEIWSSFLNFIKMNTSTIGSGAGGGGGGTANRKLKNIIEEIQLALLYPRLDINVSKGFNHLLKAPFCIHPSTGKVCLPFSSSAVAKFDPTTVPTIAQLLMEINAFDNKTKIPSESNQEKSRIKDYKKTSMFKGVVVFEEFLRKIENNLKNKAISVSDQKMEF